MAIDDVILNMNNVKSKLAKPVGPNTPNLPNGPTKQLGGGIAVSAFPIHLYPPEGADTFDVRKSVQLTSPDDTVTLVDFTLPKNCVAVWNGYSLFSDVAAGVTAEWFLTIDGAPVFPYHGDSTNGFKKTLALSTDLSNLIYALKGLRGEQNIKIIGKVSATLPLTPWPATIAARIVGWIIPQSGEIKVG